MAGKRLQKGQYRKVPGRFYGTPKEVWGFRTRASTRAGAAVAREFLFANRELFKLEPAASTLQARRVIESLGAEHHIFSQFHGGLRVHRAYITVHMDRARRVYLCKNRTVPVPLLPKTVDAALSRDDAIRIAQASLPQRQRSATVRETEPLWFPLRARLAPAWKVRLVRHKPREEWIVYVNARTGRLLSSYDNLAEARAARGMVFDPS